MKKEFALVAIAALLLQGCGGEPKKEKTDDTASLGAVAAEKVEVINTDLSGYQLVWSDEFDGTSLSEVWNVEEGYIANNELQDYKKEGNHVVSDGTLKITAQKVNDNKEFGSFTSARINTRGTKSFTYGKIEARMKLPTGIGVWPAFWMLGDNIKETRWPLCGEIDIMEYVGYSPTTIHATIHSEDYNHGKNTQRGNNTLLPEGELVSDWHIYGMIWTENGFDFYIDTPQNVFYSCAANDPKTVTAWPFDAPHFLILNLAIGGDWGGAQGIADDLCPAVMEVDYVRVYQKAE
ncbi:MAG: glycoside hydrolase family 16 protein [Rikenellaceae bacterium]